MSRWNSESRLSAIARRVNGSNIRKWWIFHHYISTLCVLVLLTLPVNSAHVLEFMGPLLMMMGLQGCVMLLQVPLLLRVHRQLLHV